MRATGIVGQARCDSGARTAVLGGYARGVSWQKVGSKTANGGMRRELDKNSELPSHAQNAQLRWWMGNGGCAGVFFCLRLVIAWRGAGLGDARCDWGAEEERKAENQKCKRQRAKR